MSLRNTSKFDLPKNCEININASFPSDLHMNKIQINQVYLADSVLTFTILIPIPSNASSRYKVAF